MKKDLPIKGLAYKLTKKVKTIVLTQSFYSFLDKMNMNINCLFISTFS